MTIALNLLIINKMIFTILILRGPAGPGRNIIQILLFLFSMIVSILGSIFSKTKTIAIIFLSIFIGIEIIFIIIQILIYAYSGIDASFSVLILRILAFSGSIALISLLLTSQLVIASSVEASDKTEG